MQKQYDVVVIGAGSGGLTAAVGFSKVGKKVLLIEREHMGGECTNSGCVPSKALLHHAKSYYHAKTIAGNTDRTEVYRKGAFQYVRGKIDSILEEETPEAFEKFGINVVLGEAIFTGKCSVSANDTTYHYKRAVIASGSSPRMLDVPGLDTSSVLTNQNIFELTDVPERLLVIGSGPIGMEMGQAFAMLGSHVTIVSIDEEFGRLEDPAIRPVLRKKFGELDINIELNAHIKAVENGVAVFDRKDGDRVTETFNVPFDKVLVAIGRVPNIPKGLESADIQTNKYGIEIDEQHRTTNRNVYAVGDVADRLKFTHVADDTSRQIVTRETTKGLVRVKKQKAVPKVTYTEPEVAQVGLSFSEAQKKYDEKDILRIEVPFSQNDRAKTDSKTEGVLVIVLKRLSGKILGANIAGPSAGELISVFTLAIDQKISMWKLRSTIYAYPTYSLIIKKAGDYFFATQIGNLKVDIVSLLKRHAPKLIALTIWVFILTQLFSFQREHGMDVVDLTLMLVDFAQSSFWGPVLFVLAYVIRPITFIPGTPLTIVSGILFGFWGGLLYTVLAANLSAAGAYGIGRFFGSGIKLEDSFLSRFVTPLKERPFESVLIMRLIFLPFDVVSYLAGITKISFLSHALATFVGTLLGIALIVSIGAAISVEEFRAGGFSTDIIDLRFILLSLLILVISLGISKLLRRKHT